MTEISNDSNDQLFFPLGNTIPLIDLEIALTTIGDKLTHKECKSIMSHVVNKKKEVNIEKLVRLVMGEDENHDICIAVPHVNNAQINQQNHKGSKAVLQILN